MINRLLCLCLACFVWSLAALAQENKLIKELQNKRGDLQKQIAEQETLLKRTGKDVGSMLDGLASLNGQIEERKRYIQVINGDLERIDREQASLNRQLTRLRAELKDKKKKYEASVQFLYKNRSIEEKLMFIFSAKTLAQTYRRLRYVREYATFQRLQGEEILSVGTETVQPDDGAFGRGAVFGIAHDDFEWFRRGAGAGGKEGNAVLHRPAGDHFGAHRGFGVGIR